MADRPFPDRREQFFGRAEDIQHLTERTRRTGLTAVTAGPMMGKTWLLEELARSLESAGDCLVGFTTSYGQGRQTLRYALQDLYVAWLGDATLRQQAARAVQGERRDLFERLGPSFAKIVKDLLKGVPIIGKALGSTVEAAMDGLVGARARLTGAGTLPVLDYDAARELANAVARIAGRRIVLVLDQWEKSEGPPFELDLLDAFLREPDRWPTCHILLGLQPKPELVEKLEALSARHRGAAAVFELDDMRLDDRLERGRLVEYLGRTVPAAKLLPEDDLLGRIGGNPGVIYFWTGRDRRDPPATTEQELIKLTDDAHHQRFQQVETAVAAVSGDRRKLAIRLTLLPLVEDPTAWRSLRDFVLDGLDGDALDDLNRLGVLERRDGPDLDRPPSFGHDQRRGTAVACVHARFANGVGVETKGLILRIAPSITAVTAEAAPAAWALVSLLPVAQRAAADPLSVGLCQAAATLFGQPDVGDLLPQAARRLQQTGNHTLAPLLAMGLVNTLNHAEAADDLTRRDALLDALRALAGAHPDEAALRERLAEGLFNKLTHAKAANDLTRRDALLVELRALAGANPNEAALRERLAIGLFNTLHNAKAEDDLTRRDALLVELRALAGAHPDEAALCERLAIGLFNTLHNAKAEDDLTRRDALLEELRALAGANPNEAAVRENLAKGLCKTLNDAKAEDDLGRRDALLDELRALADANPDDAAVRENLAIGLFNTLIDAKAEGDLPRRDALLVTLRALADAHPDAAAVRENLAKGLYNTLNDAKAEDDLPRRDALLNELRALAGANPDAAAAAAVRGSLAMGLVNTLNDAKAEGDLPRRDALLNELRALAGANPDDAAARENLAMVLFNTLYQAEAEGDLPRRDALAAELCALADTLADVRALLGSRYDDICKG